MVYILTGGGDYKNERRERGTQKWRVGKGGEEKKMRGKKKKNGGLSSLALKVRTSSQWVINSELSSRGHEILVKKWWGKEEFSSPPNQIIKAILLPQPVLLIVIYWVYAMCQTRYQGFESLIKLNDANDPLKQYFARFRNEKISNN